MIVFDHASARGASERGRVRPVVTNVTFEHHAGVLAVLGALRDGTSLLLDLVDGSASPTTGRVVVLGTAPDAARASVARVSMDAPLPEALRVDEVCDLSARLRGDAPAPASERLGILGLGALAKRAVRSLTVAERRAVALALALASTRVRVLLVDEPLAALDPVAPRLVVDALRRRSTSASVIVTTASALDAVRVADALAIVTGGVLTPLPPGFELGSATFGPERVASMRIVVAPSSGKSGAGALAAALGADDDVLRVETVAYAASPDGARAAAVTVSGREIGRLARAVTRAAATVGAEIELVQPSVASLEAIRAAIAAHAALPPAPASLAPPAPPPAGVTT